MVDTLCSDRRVAGDPLRAITGLGNGPRHVMQKTGIERSGFFGRERRRESRFYGPGEGRFRHDRQRAFASRSQIGSGRRKNTLHGQAMALRVFHRL